MSKLQDHQGFPIDRFNGLWDRGDQSNVPLDHFERCNNLTSIGTQGCGTRPGVGISQDVTVPLQDILRIYNYPTQTANTLIVLVRDGDDGVIYHVVSSTLVYGPLLTIEGMTDFAFQPYAGRGYISPFGSVLPVSSPPALSLTATVVAGAGVSAGTRQYAYTFVTATGETTPSPLQSATTAGGNLQVDLTNIAVGPPGTTARKVYSTIAAGTQLKLLTTLADNVTTIFQNNTPDGSLGANAPTINTATVGTLTQERGLQGEFLYVYAGDGTAARKAAGAGMSGSMSVANGAAGHTDPGFRLFGFVSETISGYLSPPSILTTFTSAANFSVSFGSIPTSGDPNVVKRHLVSTKVITGYNGDTQGYTYYFVPNATINNNTDTFLNNISFYDSELLEDASILFDNYTEIPAGASLTLYHNRLVLTTTFEDISLLLVSNIGEPEAINQISGLMVMPLDGNPITNAQELRDVLYVFKRSRTGSFTDNGGDPSSWPYFVVDPSLGTSVHGIATVLDSGTGYIDFLQVCTYQGVSIFNGKYVALELSWKIEAFWKRQNREDFKSIQIINAPISKQMLIVLPDGTLLEGNYGNGMDYKAIRWWPWSFIVRINTIAIYNIDQIILGSPLVTL